MASRAVYLFPRVKDTNKRFSHYVVFFFIKNIYIKRIKPHVVLMSQFFKTNIYIFTTEIYFVFLERNF